jgi:acyl-CoA synthetase (AMP-forming)/AMP-acid ligase II/thioesterase domain-containing protein/acyl carrier protein
VLAPDPTGASVARPLWDAFVAAATRHPDAVAVIEAERRTAFGELLRRASAVADALDVLHRDHPVGVWMPVGSDQAAALLGLWREGRVAVPLDPLAPVEATRELLEVAGAPVVLGRAEDLDELRARLADGAGPPVLAVAAGGAIETSELPAPSRAPAAAGLGGASLSFTSGTAGRRKGVLHSQASLLWNAALNRDALGLRAGDLLLCPYPPTVNPALRDQLATLLAGAALIPAAPRRDGVEALVATAREHAATVLTAGVSLFRRLADELAANGSEGGLESVRAIRLGGEAVLPGDLRRARALFPGCRLVYRGLGTTETGTLTRCLTRFDHPAGEEAETGGRPEEDDAVALGFATEGTEVEPIAGEHGAGDPLAEVGEVVARGPGVALGYWRGPGRLEPFAGEYRTGDLVRRRSDGSLEFLGRVDRQLKLAGWRIEPEGLERRLAGLAGVRAAAVVPRDDPSSPRLRVFVARETAAAGGPAPDDGVALRELVVRTLRVALPTVAVAVDVELLAELPVTDNGKLDRRALVGRPEARGGAYAHPRDPIESRLQALWRELLGRELVGIHDDFFDLGGDSLLAATLVAEVEGRFGLRWAPSSLLEMPTIAAQAERVREAVADSGEAPLLRLAEGPGAPLFCVPAVDGYGFVFRGLTRRLDGSLPVRVLQYPGLDGNRRPCDTVEELARELTEVLVAEQPAGAVRLLGHSHGGLVAFEIARELGRRGREVETLVLCDAHVPGAVGWRARRVRDLEIAAGTAARVWRETREQGAGPAAGPAAGRWLGALARMGARGLRRRVANTAIEHRIHEVRRAQLGARRRYRSVGSVPGLERVLLLRAEPGPGRARRYLRFVEPDNGWHRLLGFAPALERVAGDHVDMLHEPHVGEVAERVAAQLGREAGGARGD